MRLSGPQALAIADKIFLAKDSSLPSRYKSYTVRYGWIVRRGKGEGLSGKGKRKKVLNLNPLPLSLNPASDRPIDEVLLTVMRAPKTYTKEDIVEISCHSGLVVLREILGLVLTRGARLAEAGEFTKRAFLNGRIDLSQAEAVLDVINAKTGAALNSGLNQLQGALSRKIAGISQRLLNILVLLEANIDFPEEDTKFSPDKKFFHAINNAYKEICELVSSADSGKVLREGLNVVIAGKTNVGKSSLLNALLKEERAIVSPIAGTTRDAIEEIMDVKGIPLKIADTAGIINPRDLIEKEALKKTQAYFDKADLVLLVFDASSSFTKEDRQLIKRAKNKRVIAVLNKCDLKQKTLSIQIRKHFKKVIRISCLTLKGFKELEEALAGSVCKGGLESSDEIILTNLRHIQALNKAKEALEGMRESVKRSLPLEFIVEDLRLCRQSLGEVTGESAREDILDKIFSQFCIGK